MTPYEIEKQKYLLGKGVDIEMPAESTQLIEIVEAHKQGPHYEKYFFLNYNCSV